MESGNASNSLCCKSNDVIFTQFPISTQRQTAYIDCYGLNQGWKIYQTTGSQKTFFCIPQNIQVSVAEEENVKQILTKVK